LNAHSPLRGVDSDLFASYEWNLRRSMSGSMFFIRYLNRESSHPRDGWRTTTMSYNKYGAHLIAIAACMAWQLAFNSSEAEEAYWHKPGAKIIDTITGLPPALDNVALNDRANLIYLTGYNWNAGIGNLLVLDGTTHKVINQISSPTLNATLLVDEYTNTLWAFSNNAGSPNGTGIEYSGSSLQVLKTIPLNNVGINEVAQNRKTGKYYVTNFNNGGIEVYDRQLHHLASLTGDDNANFVTVNEKTNKIYVTNYWDGTVTVIDGNTDTIIGNPIPIGQPIAPNDC
jgi:YVTN family beta-propeller protein